MFILFRRRGYVVGSWKHFLSFFKGWLIFIAGSNSISLNLVGLCIGQIEIAASLKTRHGLQMPKIVHATLGNNSGNLSGEGRSGV